MELPPSVLAARMAKKAVAEVWSTSSVRTANQCADCRWYSPPECGSNDIVLLSRPRSASSVVPVGAQPICDRALDVPAPNSDDVVEGCFAYRSGIQSIKSMMRPCSCRAQIALMGDKNTIFIF